MNRTEAFETCGFCQGNGHVYGSMFDAEGRRLHDEPPVETCLYCGGTGRCVNGSVLWPAESRASIIKRQSN